MEQGKVWLVGAGPSDGGLFTIKGRAVLEQAEVVVYDRLVGQAVLRLAPESAELIDVGKQAGHHPILQSEINEILYQRAKAGKRVVRLKGGDPFLFGRGAEELELLEAHGIPYEVVPGITSAVAVPAYQGIPVTHRKYASSVHIITGHKKKGENLQIDFEALYRAGGTWVFLMGLTAVRSICEGFLKAGMRPDMPAAVLENGTTAAQRKVIATVATLADEVLRHQIQSPAIIMVGEVCALAESFDWYQKLPLSGCRAVVTRAEASGSRLAEQLKAQGAEVLELPTIKTVSLIPKPEFVTAMEQIDQYHWIVFTSPAGVRLFFAALKEMKYDIRTMQGIKIAVTGPGTARELEERGIYPDLVPPVYDGKTLGMQLKDQCESDARVLVLRAEQASATLTEALQARSDISLTDMPIYRTRYTFPRTVRSSELADRSDYYALFTSASAVTGFIEGTKGMNTNPIKCICIGRQTEEKALQYGLDTVVSPQATIDALAATLVSEYNGRTQEKTQDGND